MRIFRHLLSIDAQVVTLEINIRPTITLYGRFMGKEIWIERNKFNETPRRTVDDRGQVERVTKNWIIQTA